MADLESNKDDRGDLDRLLAEEANLLREDAERLEHRLQHANWLPVSLDKVLGIKLAQLAARIMDVPARDLGLQLSTLKQELALLRRELPNRGLGPDGQSAEEIYNLINAINTHADSLLANLPAEDELEPPEPDEPRIGVVDAEARDLAASSEVAATAVDRSLDRIDDVEATKPEKRAVAREVNSLWVNISLAGIGVLQRGFPLKRLDRLGSAIKNWPELSTKALERGGVALKVVADYLKEGSALKIAGRLADEAGDKIRGYAEKRRQALESGTALQSDVGPAHDSVPPPYSEWAEYVAALEDFLRDCPEERSLVGRVGTRRGEITRQDLAAIREIRATRSGRADLSPLSGLQSLASLYLNGAQVRDLSPLSELKSLANLFLQGTQVSNLSPLSGLQSLTHLNLRNTQVSDLSPLSGLQSLANLNLRSTPVSDLSPLSGLQSLSHLYLHSAPVSDLWPLSELQRLKLLNLRNTQVSDLSPLFGLQSLAHLDLQGTRVSDLSPLSGLSSLRWLDLGGTRVSDLSPLSGLSSLTRLDLRGSQVSDLSPLSGLFSLKRLDLRGSQVSDYTSVAHVEQVFK